MQNKIQNKFLKLTLFAAIFLICFSFTESANAATYYMCNSASTCGAGWSTGSDVYTKTQAQSKATPWSTLSRAYAQMSGGDTLVIGNGIYTGSNNATFTYGGARTPPIGNADHWTTIMAENTGGVLFDGQNTEQHMFYYSPGSSDRPSSQYVIFQGLVWGRSADVAALGGVVGLVNARYVKFIDCGAYDPLPGNNSGFNAYGCDHILYEGCYAYGRIRLRYSAT